jgi:hypothetical protein
VSAKLQFLVVLCFTGITAKGTVVRLEEEKLTFMLPPGWVAIPEQTMAQKNTELQRNLSKPYPINFKYGYQIDGADWFSYPYILVKQVADARIPESKLRKLLTIDLSPAENKVRELAPKIFGNISLGRFAYDPNTQKIWSASTSTVAGGEEVRALAMMVPTERGITAFYFYATAEQYADLKPVFLQTALSVTPDPEIAYHRGAVLTEDKTNSAPWVFPIMILCWLVPGIIATNRNHPKRIPIWLLTIILGWTGIGWVAAMIWACWRIPKAKPATDLEPLTLD